MNPVSKFKKETIACLESIKEMLDDCINEGMMDLNAHFYNEIVDFLEEAHLAKTFEELKEVITDAKILETDIDAWLSRKGKTTVSLSWPQIP